MKPTIADAPVLSTTIVALVSTLLVVISIAQSIAQAQNTALDVVAPVIELEEIPEGVIGQAQVFTALVSDTGTIKDVKLYFRFRGVSSYASVLMTSLANTDYYTATIDTAADDPRAIEYYIQARDEGGNRVVKGFAFDPFVRTMTQAVAPPVPSGGQSEPAATGGIKIWQVVLGVLALGAIAGAAASGSGDSGTPSEQVPLTLTISTP